MNERDQLENLSIQHSRYFHGVQYSRSHFIRPHSDDSASEMKIQKLNLRR
jgi:hypothetical protein